MISDFDLKRIGFKNLMRISVPIMVGGLSNTIVNLTDTAFLSRLGEVELGGAGNAGLLFFLLIIIGMGFATGSQILIGRRNGQEQYATVGSLVQHCLLFLLFYGSLIFAFLQIGLSLFLPYAVNSPQIQEVIVTFLETRSWGIFFNYINLAFFIFYVGITKTRIIGIVTPVIAVLNIALDYGLIFGNFGLPQLGVQGAALASNISELVGSVMLLIYTFSVYKNSIYKLFQWQGISLNRFKLIFNLSIPLMAQNFFSLASWFVFFSIIEHMGESELAASHIVRSIYMVLIIPVFGMGDTSNSLTSNLLGEGKPQLVIPMLKNIVLLSILIIVALQPIYYLFGESLFYAFTNNPVVVQLGDPVMQIVFTALFPFAIAIMGFRMITGAGKTLTSLIIEIITIIIYLSSAYWISHMSGVELYHVWLMEFVYFGFFCILVYSYIWKGNWRESKL